MRPGVGLGDAGEHLGLIVREVDRVLPQHIPSAVQCVGALMSGPAVRSPACRLCGADPGGPYPALRACRRRVSGRRN